MLIDIVDCSLNVTFLCLFIDAGLATRHCCSDPVWKKRMLSIVLEAVEILRSGKKAIRRVTKINQTCRKCRIWPEVDI